MTGIRFFLLLSLVVLPAACTSRVESPFSVDAAGGSFSLEAEGYFPGPCGVKLNEIEALRGAHIFQGKDSLVAIGSCGGLDVLMVFKEMQDKPLLQISVINPGDSALKISSLKVYSRIRTDMNQRLIIGLPGAGKDALWTWSEEENETAYLCSLNLSGSSVYLLPEERIILPPLHFFSHL